MTTFKFYSTISFFMTFLFVFGCADRPSSSVKCVRSPALCGIPALPPAKLLRGVCASRRAKSPALTSATCATQRHEATSVILSVSIFAGWACGGCGLGGWGGLFGADGARLSGRTDVELLQLMIRSRCLLRRPALRLIPPPVSPYLRSRGRWGGGEGIGPHAPCARPSWFSRLSQVTSRFQFGCSTHINISFSPPELCLQRLQCCQKHFGELTVRKGLLNSWYVQLSVRQFPCR